MSIAETLRRAADEHLWDGFDGGMTYSCDAVAMASDFYGFDACKMFLRELGCPCGSLSAFNNFKSAPERQGARYLWLHFAALVAEDMGV